MQGEFSWGLGITPNPERGYELTAFDRLKATRLTDHDNPEADEDAVYSPTVTRSGHNEDGTYAPGNLRMHATAPVVEDAVLPSTGQHAPIDPSVYTPGHEPDGEQDGSGAAWRASVPPNPKR